MQGCILGNNRSERLDHAGKEDGDGADKEGGGWSAAMAKLLELDLEGIFRTPVSLSVRKNV